MRMNRPFGAVLTAMVTPMHPDGSIDFDAAQRLATFLVDNGSDGLVVSGTTGESPTTHSPEKVDLIRAVKDVVGSRAQIVAGAGSNDTAHAVRMAEQAAEAGADGLLSVTPYYSKPSQRGVVAHFRAIAAATDLPVMLYDIPGRTGIPIGDDAIDTLAHVDTIVAVKDATGNVAQAKDRILRTGLAWYSGDDHLTLDFIRVGASGVVSVASHVVGPAIARMFIASDAGDVAAAEAADDECEPMVQALMGAGLGVVYAKAALQAMGIIDSRFVRLPQVPLDDDEYARLRSALVGSGIL
jgi:4-hydroxy-tetrahydrodipicolinate synthase